MASFIFAAISGVTRKGCGVVEKIFVVFPFCALLPWTSPPACLGASDMPVNVISKEPKLKSRDSDIFLACCIPPYRKPACLPVNAILWSMIFLKQL